MRDGKTTDIEHSSKHAFTAKDLAQMSKNDKDDEGTGSADMEAYFEYRQIIPQPDGSIIVNTEKEYSGVTKEHWIYHTDDILSFRISKTGDILWLNVIPKRQAQQEAETRLSYYFLTAANGNSYFFYNDHQANINQPLSTRAKSVAFPKNRAVAIVCITPDGKAERKELVSLRDLDIFLLPKNSGQINANEFFIRFCEPFDSDWPERFGVVTLE